MSSLTIFLIILIGYVIPMGGNIVLYWICGHITEVWCSDDSKPDWKCFFPVLNIFVFVILFFATIWDYIHPPYWSGLYEKRHKSE